MRCRRTAGTVCSHIQRALKNISLISEENCEENESQNELRYTNDINVISTESYPG